MSLLPSESVLERWTAAETPQVYEDNSLYDFIDGGAEIFFEYGFKSAVYQEYSMNDTLLQTEIYDMTDDAAAFGIFSVNKSPRATNVPLGAGGQQYGDTVTFWQQNYYVVVRLFGGKGSHAEMALEVAQDIEGKIGSERGTMPKIVSLLPKLDKVVGSEMFIGGKIALDQVYYLGEDEPFDLGRGRGAAVATYKIGDDTFKLLVVKYDTQHELDEAFAKTAKLFGDRFEFVERSETQFKARDRTGKLFWATKRGFVLAVALGAQSADVARFFSSVNG